MCVPVALMLLLCAVSDCGVVVDDGVVVDIADAGVVGI